MIRSDEPRMSYTEAGYRQIKQVNKRDRRWRLWKMLSQLFVFILIVISAWAAYGSYHGRITWPWVTGYWAILALKNLWDFLAGRLKP